MSPRHAVLLGLLALALAAPLPAFAKVVTLADDAGTGEDAPESGDPGFRAEPDAWRWANLSAPFDTADVYAIDLAAGDTLSLGIRPINERMQVDVASAAGEVVFHDSLLPVNRQLSLPIAETGTYYVTFTPYERVRLDDAEGRLPEVNPSFVSYYFRVAW